MSIQTRVAKLEQAALCAPPVVIRITRKASDPDTEFQARLDGEKAKAPPGAPVTAIIRTIVNPAKQGTSPNRCFMTDKCESMPTCGQVRSLLSSPGRSFEWPLQLRNRAFTLNRRAAGANLMDGASITEYPLSPSKSLENMLP